MRQYHKMTLGLSEVMSDPSYDAVRRSVREGVTIWKKQIASGAIVEVQEFVFSEDGSRWLWVFWISPDGLPWPDDTSRYVIGRTEIGKRRQQAWAVEDRDFSACEEILDSAFGLTVSLHSPLN